MRKNILKAFIAFGAIAMFASCSSDNFESKFDENPTERFENRKKDLTNDLLSSEFGWKATYFTNDQKYGGYTHLMKFKDATNVEMISDFDLDSYNGLKAIESEYKIGWSTTVSLMFNTPNHIHMLANNQIAPGKKGKGFEGDFEFLFKAKNGLDLDFITVRSNVDVKFERAQESDWEDIKFHNDTKNALNVKRNLVLIENGEETTFSFKFDRNTRWALILNADQTESVNGTGGVGIGFRKDGLVVSPAIEFEDGTSVSEFVKDGTTYVAQVGTNRVIIK